FRLKSPTISSPSKFAAHFLCESLCSLQKSRLRIAMRRRLLRSFVSLHTPPLPIRTTPAFAKACDSALRDDFFSSSGSTVSIASHVKTSTPLRSIEYTGGGPPLLLAYSLP